MLDAPRPLRTSPKWLVPIKPEAAAFGCAANWRRRGADGSTRLSPASLSCNHPINLLLCSPRWRARKAAPACGVRKRVGEARRRVCGGWVKNKNTAGMLEPKWHQSMLLRSSIRRALLGASRKLRGHKSLRGRRGPGRRSSQGSHLLGRLTAGVGLEGSS